MALLEQAHPFRPFQAVELLCGVVRLVLSQPAMCCVMDQTERPICVIDSSLVREIAIPLATMVVLHLAVWLHPAAQTIPFITLWRSSKRHKNDG